MKLYGHFQLQAGIQMLYCVLIAVGTLYALIDQQNQVTELQMYLPVLEKEVKGLREANNELRYQIARFEDPKRLIGLLDSAEKKLVFPDDSEVVEITWPQN